MQQGEQLLGARGPGLSNKTGKLGIGKQRVFEQFVSELFPFFSFCASAFSPSFFSCGAMASKASAIPQARFFPRRLHSDVII